MFTSKLIPFVAAMVAILVFIAETIVGVSVVLGVNSNIMLWFILFQSIATSCMVASVDPTYHHLRIGGIYAGTLGLGAFIFFGIKEPKMIALALAPLAAAWLTYAVRRLRFRQRSIHTIMGR